MHYGLLVIILYIVLVFKLVHEPFYVPKNLFFGPKMIFLGDYGKKWRRLIMLKINFFVCHMTFNWPSRAFKLVHQPFYVPKQPFLGQKWCFKAIMTKVKKVNFSFDIHLGIGVRVTIRKNVIDGIDVANPSKWHSFYVLSLLYLVWSRSMSKKQPFGPKITF